MSVTPKVLIPAKLAEVAETTQYTAPTGIRTIIDKFTGTNVTGVAATMTVRIVTVGGAAGASNTITLSKTIQPSDSYTFPEVVGHILGPGDFISTAAGTAASISTRASGREVN